MNNTEQSLGPLIGNVVKSFATKPQIQDPFSGKSSEKSKQEVLDSIDPQMIAALLRQFGGMGQDTPQQPNQGAFQNNLQNSMQNSSWANNLFGGQ